MNEKQQKVNKLTELIEVARGTSPADLIIKNASVVNVFSGEILHTDVAIKGDTIAGVGNYYGKYEVDAEGRFLTPGLIDSHMHLESSLLSPAEFTRAVLPHGTTAVIIDPHEIANVAGIKGIEEILAHSKDLPIEFYVMASSCVPASELETSGAMITAQDILALYEHEGVLGLAEVMDFVDVLKCQPDMLDKIAVSHNRPIDGHAPGVVGKDLAAYCAAGMESDHESITAEEGKQKLQNGMYLMLRQGSAARNLREFVPLINFWTSSRCLLVTDDLLPTDIRSYGHIDHLLRMLVQEHIDPVTAIRMATLNSAQRFGLKRHGAVAPGYRANLVLFDDLASFKVSMVVSSGQVAYSEGEILASIPRTQFSDQLTDSVHMGNFKIDRLRITAADGLCRVIGAQDGQLVTDSLLMEPAVISNRVAADIERDILKIAVVERHKATGNVGVGLIHGFGLKHGALASSVAHDAHNIVAVGASDFDMALAIRHIEALHGGLVVVSDGKVFAELPLPIGGLMTDLTYEETCVQLSDLENAARDLGSSMVHPFMTLSFMALEVIPELKITDKGLVDVSAGTFVNLFTTGGESTAARAASG